MKKILLFAVFLASSLGFSQVQNVTFSIDPSAFNENEEITITVSNVNPSAWGVNDIYLWAWYFDTNGDFGGDSPTNGEWTNSDEAQKFTDNGNGTYSYTLTPTTFYNTTGISRMGMLVKAKDGSGDKKSQDHLVDVGRFQLNLSSPSQNLTILNSGESISISATTTENADFSLKANGTEADVLNNATSYTNNYTVTQSTSFQLDASNGSETQSESFEVIVKPTVTEEALPSGLLDGLNPDPNDNTKATLVLFAPEKEFVYVIGDFNNWQIDGQYLMKKDSSQDRFWIELSGLTPQSNHMYQYLVDGVIRIADPYSEVILDEFNDAFIDATTYPNLPSYPTGSTNHAVTLMRLDDPEYVWQTTNFQKPEVTDLVIYELLIRDFDELHSFDAVRDRLDYLESLGVNAIELMPVSEFDGNISWGYNSSFHMALDKYYGTQDAFKRFVDECHSRGIAVILDVVYNHATGQNPYFRLWNECGGNYDCAVAADNPFFNVNSPNTAFSFFNDMDHTSQATQDYVDRLNRYWLEEYNIDGYRFDFTKGFTNTVGDGNSFDQARIDILTRMYNEIRTYDTDAYVILEHFAPNSEETQLINSGMLVWGNHNFNYNEATLGYHDNGKSNFSSISYLNRGWSTPSNVGYMESHDEERLMNKNLQFGNSDGDYDVKDLATALERQQLAGAFYFSIPGPKMIWQFGELGYDFSINHCEDGSVDESCRTSPKPIRWDYLDQPDRAALYENWSDLIKLKLNEAIFKSSEFTLDVGNANGLKKIQITDQSATGDEIRYITILGNFGVTEQQIVPGFQETGTWYNLLENNRPMEISNTDTPISLAPGAYMIMADQPSLVLIDPNDTDADGVPNADDACPDTPFGATVDVTGCEIFTLPSSNFALKISSETCRSSNNGSIEITAAQALNYTATLSGNGINTSDSFTNNVLFTDLEAGSYEVCITVEGINGYEQCFSLNISEPENLSVFSAIDSQSSTVTLSLNGGNNYNILLNGKLTTTNQSSITLELNRKENTLVVSTDKDCQGTYEETIIISEDILIHPNPVNSGDLVISLPALSDPDVNISMYSYTGKMLLNKVYNQAGRQIRMNMDAYPGGIYILRVQTASGTSNYKILKR
ncbi:T9SS type A sorting domain-containing protein [Leptobacterium flavescens]|uniref:T9SS type A sorting domain-containing protein n=1 Tax=Leptobacterium flavescens TaxID=472055 RepID=A0A6P0UW38_9FLAO|nr:alpha-amylase family glycosyl hydrolase [Leptobacterium flavescens]NER14646.1 T9SS type A sorting domain-containing protein [Leptobacterium flavescens]